MSEPPEKAKHGNKNYFTGFKFAFLADLVVEFHHYLSENQPGVFYDYVTRRFFRKYGFTKTGEFNIEPAEDPEEGVYVDVIDDNGSYATEVKAQEYQVRFKEL